MLLNKQKWELFLNKVEFFGFVFSENGITPSQTEIESIQKMLPPTNISELCSFLGMTNYLSRFIPNYYMRIYPLLELTKKNIHWLWTYKRQTISDDLKTELISLKVMSYYDLSLNSLIVTDASPVGISDFTISHIKGAVNPDVCPEVFSLQEIRDKTIISLQKIISKMQNNKEEINIENKELKILLHLLPKLTLTPDEIMLKVHSIIISNELKRRVIELAHENHLGIAKTIALLRENIYFVNMEEANVKAKISE